MKKLLQLACLLFLVSVANATPTLVRVTAIEGSTVSLNASFGSSVATGNFLVAIVVNFNTTSVTSVVDTNATSLVQAVQQNTQTLAAIYYETVTSGGVTGVTVNASFASMGLIIAEYSGVASSSQLDGTSANDNGFSPGSTSVTSNNTAALSTTGELAIGAVVQWRSGTYTLAAGSGWTSEQVSTSGNIMLMDQVLSSTSALAATGTVSPSANSQTYVVIATFKPFSITPVPNGFINGTVLINGKTSII